MGNRPATISELVDAVNVTRGLLRGERVTHRWRGEETEIEFLDKTGTWYDIVDVPIWMAAGGPKGLQGRRRPRRRRHLLPRPEPGHDQTRPPRTGRRRRGRRPAKRVR